MADRRPRGRGAGRRQRRLPPPGVPRGRVRRAAAGGAGAAAPGGRRGADPGAGPGSRGGRRGGPALAPGRRPGARARGVGRARGGPTSGCTRSPTPTAAIGLALELLDQVPSDVDRVDLASPRPRPRAASPARARRPCGCSRPRWPTRPRSRSAGPRCWSGSARCSSWPATRRPSRTAFRGAMDLLPDGRREPAGRPGVRRVRAAGGRLVRGWTSAEAAARTRARRLAAGRRPPRGGYGAQRARHRGGDPRRPRPGRGAAPRGARDRAGGGEPARRRARLRQPQPRARARRPRLDDGVALCREGDRRAEQVRPGPAVRQPPAVQHQRRADQGGPAGRGRGADRRGAEPAPTRRDGGAGAAAGGPADGRPGRPDRGLGALRAGPAGDRGRGCAAGLAARDHRDGGRGGAVGRPSRGGPRAGHRRPRGDRRDRRGRLRQRAGRARACVRWPTRRSPSATTGHATRRAGVREQLLATLADIRAVPGHGELPE